ncbi:hypothetical protein PQ472_05095 [Lacticaseibacillus pabuli]|uniref:Uncharacterized protein n=1 Tax=Lacticaseibacillus pabuli TaxID=3025672 RepID=A0ABY7WTX2_9LACO|nr:hypothetical protein [Lacticaseibacillus sp. KACC 23028]WDF83613.1 hypothetical protein PQ472_05095 [Lacticaseibacillus sp. KACC 23028]
MLSLEDFEGIAPGDTVHVSKDFRMSTADVTGEIRGGFDWVVINRYQKTVSVELTGQDATLMRAFNGKTVVPRRYISSIVQRSGNLVNAEPTLTPDSPGEGIHRGNDRSSIAMHERVHWTAKLMRQGKKRGEIARILGVSPQSVGRYMAEIRGERLASSKSEVKK